MLLVELFSSSGTASAVGPQVAAILHYHCHKNVFLQTDMVRLRLFQSNIVTKHQLHTDSVVTAQAQVRDRWWLMTRSRSLPHVTTHTRYYYTRLQCHQLNRTVHNSTDNKSYNIARTYLSYEFFHQQMISWFDCVLVLFCFYTIAYKNILV